MARSAWAKLAKVPTDRLRLVGMPDEGTMTRGEMTGFSWSSDKPRVDARVKDLTEMTIGRTDDPENPLKPVALEAA